MPPVSVGVEQWPRQPVLSQSFAQFPQDGRLERKAQGQPLVRVEIIGHEVGYADRPQQARRHTPGK